ncbi:MAG: hypothetical protein H0U95_13535 [Bacteroidetes bacterium]|nr:hypothetical protein [Bacteroidota bacterium]
MKTKFILFFVSTFFSNQYFTQDVNTIDTTYYSNTIQEEVNSNTKKIQSINYKLNGVLTKQNVFFQDGKTKYSEANYVNGLLNGKIIYFCKNGNISSIYNYINGKKEGVQLSFYDAFGSIRNVSNYKDGQIEGRLMEFYENGDTSLVSEYSSGQLNKKITYSHNNKRSNLVTYKAGKRHGPTILYHKNGNIEYTCTYQDDKMYGLRMCYDPAGNTSEGNFVFYNEDGSKEREGKCINGKPEGELKLYHHNRVFMLVNFKDGKPHGMTYYYDRNGIITSTEEYNNGEYVKQGAPDK